MAENTNKNLIERLYIKYERMMFDIANGILKNSHEAEELVHEVFYNILQSNALSKIKQFDSSAEKGYIISIIKNEAYKRYNIMEQTAAVDIDELYGLAGGESAEDEAFNEFEAELVDKALLKLPPIDYEILYLSFFCGLSNKEIAEQMNITENAVYQRIFRAKARLKKILIEEDMSYDKQ